jgi:hypothetical protein
MGPFDIIDSGATNHMTGNLDMLTNSINATQHSPITVANGSKVTIQKVGTAILLSNISSDVFYLPTFISKL